MYHFKPWSEFTGSLYCGPKTLNLSHKIVNKKENKWYYQTREISKKKHGAECGKYSHEKISKWVLFQNSRYRDQVFTGTDLLQNLRKSFVGLKKSLNICKCLKNHSSIWSDVEKFSPLIHAKNRLLRKCIFRYVILKKLRTKTWNVFSFTWNYWSFRNKPYDIFVSYEMIKGFT